MVPFLERKDVFPFQQGKSRSIYFANTRRDPFLQFIGIPFVEIIGIHMISILEEPKKGLQKGSRGSRNSQGIPKGNKGPTDPLGLSKCIP